MTGRLTDDDDEQIEELFGERDGVFGRLITRPFPRRMVAFPEDTCTTASSRPVRHYLKKW